MDEFYKMSTKDFIKLKEPLVLASNSPRRKSILEEVGISPIVIPSNVNEDVDTDVPEDVAVILAKRKALDVAKTHRDEIVLGADTIVVCDGKIHGKPKDKEDAFNMLTFFSGKYNYVYTGVCISYKDRVESFCVNTAVKMFDNPSYLLRKYVETGIPLDKSGSYGIQGLGSLIIEAIEGDYYSVMGLPVGRVIRQLDEMSLVLR